MEDMACDRVASHGSHLITRIGEGAERSMLIWQYKETGGVEDDPMDEIE